MPSFDDARHLILANVGPIGAGQVELSEALGYVLAEDVLAPWDMPRCDNSAMDGFAVRAEECRPGAILPISGYIAAGCAAMSPLLPGTAVKIMTGAPVPAGCNAVVPFEEAEESDHTVRLNAAVAPRQHVRFCGEDVREREVIVPRGTVVHATEISMLASFGTAAVSAYRKPRVAIVSTGDELLEPGTPLSPGHVFDANSLSLAAAVRETGAIPVLIGIARDDRASHREKLAQGLHADALITSAGVSAGDRDLVREVLQELGAQQIFWRVDMKPGGPTAFALYQKKPVFCLPGNPVATLITFEEFVRPALLKMMGHRRVLKPFRRAVLKHEVKKKPGKMKILRVKLETVNGRTLAGSAGDQNTGMLKTMLRADALALIPADCASLAAGNEVDIHLLNPETELIEG